MDYRRSAAAVRVFLVLCGICTGLSWLSYFRALQMGPAPSVAPLDELRVVLVILGAWLFLGEQLTPLKIVGGSLVTPGGWNPRVCLMIYEDTQANFDGGARVIIRIVL
jgi:uncharacterized membrane protein